MSKSIYDERYRELIEALRTARREAGITQQQVALALDKPQSYVAKFEGHERRLDMIEFLQVADSIGWNPFPHLEKTFEKMTRDK
ncbi:helix-turn-helix transcriptional regulator [uncultured Roseovarius sp.]|uniref:helix-turn-helix domain-containing protein n=1 Tax=uncultured Roseovarius sp. TaxID=293344 RepID=UPI00261BDC63|nr:helix-turn-helix transcriptional regulator [uncultured Roseovarius sp.]